MTWYNNKYKHSLSAKGIKSKSKYYIKKDYDKMLLNFLKINLKNYDIKIEDDILWIFTKNNGNKLIINMYIDNEGNVHQTEIDAYPSGTGMGTEIMNLFKKYAKKYNKYINLNEVKNPYFVKQLGGFKRVYINKNDKAILQSNWNFDDLNELEFFTYN